MTRPLTWCLKNKKLASLSKSRRFISTVLPVDEAEMNWNLHEGEAKARRRMLSLTGPTWSVRFWRISPSLRFSSAAANMVSRGTDMETANATLSRRKTWNRTETDIEEKNRGQMRNGRDKRPLPQKTHTREMLHDTVPVNIYKYPNVGAKTWQNKKTVRKRPYYSPTPSQQ